MEFGHERTVTLSAFIFHSGIRTVQLDETYFTRELKHHHHWHHCYRALNMANLSSLVPSKTMEHYVHGRSVAIPFYGTAQNEARTHAWTPLLPAWAAVC